MNLSLRFWLFIYVKHEARSSFLDPAQTWDNKWISLMVQLIYVDSVMNRFIFDNKR